MSCFSLGKLVITNLTINLFATCTIMKDEELLAAISDVAERINNGEIENLLEIDWEYLTGGFKESYLKKLLAEIKPKLAKLKTVRSCLAFYEAYLIEQKYDYYLKCWEHCCQFKDFCKALIRSLENYDSFILKEINPRKNSSYSHGDLKDLPEQLRTPFAKKLLARLYPEYCDRNGHWRENIKISFICQVAHVLSGLTNIPTSRKWVYFERMWHVKGLARAYVRLDGRPIDPVIRRLFPEYKAY